MVRYWFAWMPAALVFATIVVLVSPYLALLALLGLVLAVFAAVVVLAQAAASAVAGLARRLEGGRRSRVGVTAASTELDAPRAAPREGDGVPFGPPVGMP